MLQRKRFFYGLVSLIFVVALLSVLAVPLAKPVSAATLYVNPGESIQAAVIAANPGDTIIVRSGTYAENVNVNKDHLTIQSENGAEVTIIQAANSDDHVFEITTDYVSINGFTCSGATGTYDGWASAGIYLNAGVDHCRISANILSDNYFGIWLNNSNNNSINHNNASDNHVGINIWSPCRYNTINNNIANMNSFAGICLYLSSYNKILSNTFNSNDYWGIRLYGSSNNDITNNNAKFNNYGGILLQPRSTGILYSRNNVIKMNTFQTNVEYCIHLYDSDDNRIFLNDFICNAACVYSEDSTNTWISPEELTYAYSNNVHTNYLGNYWSDFTAIDADGDGIRDGCYLIDGDIDSYPLREPFENYVMHLKRPVDGYVTSPFGWRDLDDDGQLDDYHDAIDIAGLLPGEIEGAEIYAPLSGTVDDVGNNPQREGYWIRIRHGKVLRLDGTVAADVTTGYCHLLEMPDLEKGDKVAQGQVIGRVGDTGTSYGAHLHFVVRESGKAVNPLKYVEYEARPGSGLKIETDCPVDIVVQDPDGHIISKDLMEIVRTATYLEDDFDNDGDMDDLIWLTDRKAGDYLINIVPEPGAAPTDTYTLEVSGDGTTIVLAEDVQISNIPVEGYMVRSTETEIVQIVPATIDFDPDVLFLSSKTKYVTTYIELPTGYDVGEIDISTVQLNDTVIAESKPMKVGDHDEDGIPDLMVKFDGAEVQGILDVGDDVEITVTGVVDGIDFEGSDTIRVIDF